MGKDNDLKDLGNLRRITPLALAPALLGLGAAALVIGNHSRLPVRPSPSTSSSTPVVYGPPAPPLPRVYGPPLPAKLALARDAEAKKAAGVASKNGALRGGMGPIGPIQGPLSAELTPGGPVVGPSWNRNPLPGLASLNLPFSNDPRTRSTDAPGADSAPAALTGPPVPADGSSVLPDPAKLAVSRKANPTLEVRERVARAADTTADKPVSLSLDLGESPAPRRTGEIVAVRMNATAASFFLLLRIDASGKASTVFRSARPAQRVACVLRAGAEPGAEYLIALAAVNPLNGEDVAAALKGLPASFTAPAGATGGLQPAAAWTAVVQHASTVGGTPDPVTWQRHQWSVATASFATGPKADPAKKEEKPGASLTTQGAAAKAPAGKAVPAGAAPSQLPAAKPTTGRPEKVKPEAPRVPQPADGSTLPDPILDKESG